jgi:FMN phosphatase YigB (HAD superfamily)
MKNLVISVDFWNTIAKSNPEFKSKQAEALGVSPEKWRSKTQNVKNIANLKCLNMKVGEQKLPPQDHFYDFPDLISEEQIVDFIEFSNKLFTEYPPIPIESTLKQLKFLLEYRDNNPEQNIKVGIVSNTLSIRGNKVREFLYNKLGLKLDFYNFSDKLVIAKPNPNIFKTKFGLVDVHIGDEPKYDNIEEILTEGIYLETGKFFLNTDQKGALIFNKLTKGDIKSFSTFKYSKNEFSSLDEISFNLRDYSKLKYGSGLIAKKFGKALSKGLYYSVEFDKFLKQVGSKKIVISSAPYKYIPVAATALQKEVIKNLNILLSKENKGSLEDLKVFRGHSYNMDYGSLTKEGRDKALSSDSFHIDSDFIKDKALILVDDVRITGAHERRMESLLKRVGYQGEVLYLYFAEYKGDSNASIENDLNFASLDGGLNTLKSIIDNENFIFNTRATKYILSYNFEDFKSFIISMSPDFIEELYSCAVGNEYLEIPEFKENLTYLKTFL